MKDKKVLDNKEIEKKLSDLKIEILKQPQKRKRIKKEIARLLTMKQETKSMENPKLDISQNKSGGKE
jgi:ribosomal protein L29